MYPRKPLPHAEQIARMKSYVRRLEAQRGQRYKELFLSTRGRRRECPFEVRLRSKQAEQATEISALAEACLLELRRQEAMFFSPYKPGDRILTEFKGYRGLVQANHYLVVDVRPERRGGYSYEVLPLTKSGMPHKGRGPYAVSPHPGCAIRLSDRSVTDEAEAEAGYWRQAAKVGRELSYVKGDLGQFEAVNNYLGLSHFRRKNSFSA